MKMKVGIMQPYFFPYIGYWQLINAVDLFVIYDDVNYIKKGWINRNRILVGDGDEKFHISIQKASQNRTINQLEVASNFRERRKTLRTIELAYKRAPYFKAVYPIVEEIFFNPEKMLADFLTFSLKRTAEYLGIKTKMLRSSEIDKDNTRKGQDKIIDICEMLGADVYYNPIGGKELYSSEDFRTKGIQLYFLKTEEIIYQQYKNEFVPNLSILDIMMFNSVEAVSGILKKFSLETN